MITCLFLCVTLPYPGQAQEQWTYTPKAQRAYDFVLNLQPDSARRLIPEPKTAQETYIISLSETLELLLTEDPELYETYHDNYNARLGQRTKSSLPEDLFLQGELRLQWAFVYLKFGHEFDAAWNLREAYLCVKDCRDKFPAFQAIRKTSSLLQVMIGSIPEKYDWVVSLMGMEGSISEGLEELQSLRHTSHTLDLEADLLYASLQGFLLQQPDKGMAVIETMLEKYPDQRLVNLVGAAIAIKASRSEEALKMLLNLEKNYKGTRLAYGFYLKGEVYLHKAQYVEAERAYRWFINNFKGQNNIKDAYYKIVLCFWLNGNANDAQFAFEAAKGKGREASEADKYAARCLASGELPNVPLSRARYFTDGGYYERATQVLDSIRSPQIPTTQDHIEYYYRRARLAHKQGNLEEAKKNYLLAIDYTEEDTPWYYVPNSYLQMGYIVRDEGNLEQAEQYFKEARAYPEHEYKNSIDSKAKSALSQLKDRK